jgi:Putative MetA-pathway of phenol degradation
VRSLALGRSEQFRFAPRTGRYLPEQPCRAVSWHSGFRGGPCYSAVITDFSGVFLGLTPGGCDSGSGDRVGCFQSQVVGIGPQLGFIFPVGDLQGYLNLKYYSEFAAENRPHGWNTWVTFTISPPAPTPTAPPRRMITK